MKIKSLLNKLLLLTLPASVITTLSSSCSAETKSNEQPFPLENISPVQPLKTPELKVVQNHNTNSYLKQIILDTSTAETISLVNSNITKLNEGNNLGLLDDASGFSLNLPKYAEVFFPGDKYKQKRDQVLSIKNNFDMFVRNSLFKSDVDVSLFRIQLHTALQDWLNKIQEYRYESHPELTNWAFLLDDPADGDTFYRYYYFDKQNNLIQAQTGFRFRGVDTPETDKPSTKGKLAKYEDLYAQMAKRALKSIIVQNAGVFYLNPLNTDKYNRQIGFIFKNNEMNLEDEFGAQLVKMGLGRVAYIGERNSNYYPVQTDRQEQYLHLILKLQQQAKEAQKGFWKHNINDVFYKNTGNKK
ncbi:thermonuclease family protein [Mycoplasma nasistruthionis]|uniref:TNase-like domain-containing protein n=1 Tax=Mycoplasma nasistruthionis TaxID=353852 RepID=A0A5B7XX42_9MOLU|nr:thermonuclease family protein [Mycoplasma nasistruthionis]QCZ36493.1 hypothetical protein FG904_00435 [Mycoplasma nasistruthionis]